MRPHSEQRVCPRSETTKAAALRGRQAEKASEGIWDAEQLDRHWTNRWGTLIARQPFGPGQAPMRALSTGQGWSLGERARRTTRLRLDLHPLAAHQLYASTPLFATAPVPPEQRRYTYAERM